MDNHIIPPTLRCVVCSCPFDTNGVRGVYTCSPECADELEERKRANLEAEAELADLVQLEEGPSVEYGVNEAEKARRALAGRSGKNEPRPVGLARTPVPHLGAAAHSLIELTILLAADPDLAARASDLAGEVVRWMHLKMMLGGGDDRPTDVRPADGPPDGEGVGPQAPGDEGEGEAPGGHPEGGLCPAPADVQGGVGVEVPGPGLDGWDPELVGQRLGQTARSWIDDHMLKNDGGFLITDHDRFEMSETLGRIMHDAAYSAFREGLRRDQ